VQRAAQLSQADPCFTPHVVSLKSCSSSHPSEVRTKGQKVHPPSPASPPNTYVGDYFMAGPGRVAQLAGQGTKCLGWELLSKKRCWQSPGLRLQPDKLDFVSSARSCGPFLGPLPCLSLPWLGPVCPWLPEGRAARDEAPGRGARQPQPPSRHAQPRSLLAVHSWWQM